MHLDYCSFIKLYLWVHFVSLVPLLKQTIHRKIVEMLAQCHCPNVNWTLLYLKNTVTRNYYNLLIQVGQGFIFYKEKHLIATSLQFRALVHWHHSRKQGNLQTDMILVEWLRVLHPDWQVAERERGPLGLTWSFETPKPIASDILSPAGLTS